MFLFNATADRVGIEGEEFVGVDGLFDLPDDAAAALVKFPEWQIYTGQAREVPEVEAEVELPPIPELVEVLADPAGEVPPVVEVTSDLLSAPETTPETFSVDEAPVAVPAPEMPRGSAPKRDWTAFALAAGGDPAVVAGMSRDAIRDAFIPVEAPAPAE